MMRIMCQTRTFLFSFTSEIKKKNLCLIDIEILTMRLSQYIARESKPSYKRSYKVFFISIILQQKTLLNPGVLVNAYNMLQ